MRSSLPLLFVLGLCLASAASASRLRQKLITEMRHTPADSTFDFQYLFAESAQEAQEGHAASQDENIVISGSTAPGTSISFGNSGGASISSSSSTTTTTTTDPKAVCDGLLVSCKIRAAFDAIRECAVPCNFSQPN